MSFTYPLELPSDLIPKEVELTLVRKQSKTTSEFTGADQIFVWSGEYWQLVVKYPPFNNEQERAMSAKLMELNGSEGTFYWYPTDGAVTGGATGAATVLKSITNSRKVVVTSLDLNITNWLKPGDYFSFSNGELKRVVAAASTDGAGDATLEFVPKLRDMTLSAGAQIRTVTARGIFRMISPDFTTRFYGNMISDLSFMAKEAF